MKLLISPEKSWETYGEVVVVSDLDEAVNLVNEYAPEHLELNVQNPDALIPGLCNYGSLFIGENTAEVFGDMLPVPITPCQH